jgi:hypothetical protein
MDNTHVNSVTDNNTKLHRSKMVALIQLSLITEITKSTLGKSIPNKLDLEHVHVIAAKALSNELLV